MGVSRVAGPFVDLSGFDNIGVYGADSDGLKDDSGALALYETVRSEAPIPERGVFIGANERVRVGSNTTITGTYWIQPGGGFTIDSGKTLTVNGYIIAADHQIFFGSGTASGTFGGHPSRPEWWNLSNTAGVLIGTETIDIVQSNQVRKLPLVNLLGDDLYNVLTYGADSTGASPGTFHTALESAIAAATAALAAGRTTVKVKIPPGTFRLGDAAQILQATADKYLVIEGAGSHATTIITSSGFGNLFEIGPPGASVATASKTKNVTFAGCRIAPAGSHSGAVFHLRNCADITFEDILLANFAQTGWRIGSFDGTQTLLGANPITTTNASATVTIAHTSHGFSNGQKIFITGAVAVGGITVKGYYTLTVVNANSYTIVHSATATSGATGGESVVHVLAIDDEPTSANDCVFIRIKDCGGELQASLPGAVVELGSSAAVQIGGERHRWNGEGGNETFIRQVTPGYNCDGLYVDGAFGEGYISQVDVYGKGITNAVYRGGQVDLGGDAARTLDAMPGFNFAPCASGDVRGFIIESVSARFIEGDFLLMDGTASNASVQGIVINGNDLHNVAGHVINCIEGEGVVTGNIIRNGGQSGTSLFLEGATGNLTIVGNRAQNDSIDSPDNPYTYAIEYQGSGGTDSRMAANNTWLNYSIDEETGAR